jgi:DNA-binding CsgD family transcriptional regulator
MKVIAVPAALPNRAFFCSKCMRSVHRRIRSNVPELTSRQRKCLEGYYARKTAKQIGRELGISHHAVEQHMKAARRKLGARDTAEAARLYFGVSDTTMGPYYEWSEVSSGDHEPSLKQQPESGAYLLRDIVTDGPGSLQTLTPKQTLIAIGLCGMGMITILSLIVAVANGAAQLAH